MRPLVALLAAVLLGLTACGTSTGAAGDAAGSPATAVGGSEGGAGTAPPASEVLDFRSQTVSGDAFDGESLAGRPTVLWFWSPWCPTCPGQIDGVNALADRFAGEVEVVRVGGLDEPEAIEDFASRVSDDVTVLSDSDGSVWWHFGVTAQSTYLVLDADGGTRASGYLDDAELASVVDEMVD